MRSFAKILLNNKGRGIAILASTASIGVTVDKTQDDSNPVGSVFSFQPITDSKPAFLDAGLSHLPQTKITRRVSHLLDDNNKLDLRLYQFQACPFCCKVRAFLDYYGFGYEVVEVNSVTKREIKFSDYKKVPIVVAKGWDGKQLNDSSFIVSFLKTYFVDPDKSLEDIKSCYPIFVVKDDDDSKDVKFENDNKYFVMYDEKLKDKIQIAERREEREWRRWVDEKLVHVISPNIYRSVGESIESFEWFSKSADWPSIFPLHERLFIVYVGAYVMYFVGKKLKNKHNLKPDVRESLYDVCREWCNAVGPNRKFMGGDRPNLADLAVYGVLSSFEGCRAFQDMLAHTKISPWYFATKEAVQSRLGAEEFKS